MDIVTHAMIGGILAAPLFPGQPALACGLLFGSALPDLDSLSRLFGKRAFMTWHQTFTHSVPVIAAVAALGWLVAAAVGGATLLGLGLGPLGTGLALGMLLHTALDLTNTYGVAVLAPMSPRRVCREWVFFIDAPVIGACLVALGLIALAVPRAPVALGFLLFAVLYWPWRAGLVRRAHRLAPPGTVSLIPTTFVPWRFCGFCRDGTVGKSYLLDARSGGVAETEVVRVHDEELDDVVRHALRGLPEYRVMRRLSGAYHVVQVQPQRGGTRVLCRDMRTRYHGMTFGDLTAVVTEAGAVAEMRFHV